MFMAESATPAVSVEDLIAAGFYDPEADDAADRLAALQLLVDRGATLDDLRGSGGDFGLLVSRLALLPPGERLARDQLAERAGVPVEVVERLWRAAGFADPGPDAAIATEKNVALFQSFAAAVSLFGDEAVFQLIRVIGSAMARVADAIVSAFNVNVAQGATADTSGLAIVQANLESLTYLPMLVEAMDQLLRLHLVAAARHGVPSLEAGYEAQQLSVGFVDLVDSTALSQRLSGRALGAALGSFEAEASDVIVKEGGRVVKLIGDEIMFVTQEAAAAYRTALELGEAFSSHAVLPAVRIGLATGEVLTQGGDCFGTVVSLAARAAKEARPGEVMVAGTDERMPPWCRLADVAERELKGFGSPVLLGRLERTDRP